MAKGVAVATAAEAAPAGRTPAASRPDIARGTTKPCTAIDRYPAAAKAPRAPRVPTLTHGTPPPTAGLARGLTGMALLSLRVPNTPRQNAQPG